MLADSVIESLLLNNIKKSTSTFTLMKLLTFVELTDVRNLLGRELNFAFIG